MGGDCGCGCGGLGLCSIFPPIPRTQAAVPLLAGLACYLFLDRNRVSPELAAMYTALIVYLSQLASEHLLYKKKFP